MLFTCHTLIIYCPPPLATVNQEKKPDPPAEPATLATTPARSAATPARSARASSSHLLLPPHIYSLLLRSDVAALHSLLLRSAAVVPPAERERERESRAHS